MFFLYKKIYWIHRPIFTEDTLLLLLFLSSCWGLLAFCSKIAMCSLFIWDRWSMSTGQITGPSSYWPATPLPCTPLYSTMAVHTLALYHNILVSTPTLSSTILVSTLYTVLYYPGISPCTVLYFTGINTCTVLYYPGINTCTVLYYPGINPLHCTLLSWYKSLYCTVVDAALWSELLGEGRGQRHHNLGQWCIPHCSLPTSHIYRGRVIAEYRLNCGHHDTALYSTTTAGGKKEDLSYYPHWTRDYLAPVCNIFLFYFCLAILAKRMRPLGMLTKCELEKTRRCRHTIA